MIGPASTIDVRATAGATAPPSEPVAEFLIARGGPYWALLLRELARLDVRLVATHPDGMGRLAFVGRYPNVFSVFVFALSSVLAAAQGGHAPRLGRGRHPPPATSARSSASSWAATWPPPTRATRSRRRTCPTRRSSTPRSAS